MIGGFKTIRQAKDRMRELEIEQERLDKIINALIYKFNYTYKSKPPAHLTKARGRGLIWRMKANGPSEQFFFTFTSERIDAFLESIPPITRKHFLELEEERASLQLQKKYIESAKRVTQDWIKHKQAIKKLSRDHL